eukprot:2202278-Karenia_brevis.AAC.1
MCKKQGPDSHSSSEAEVRALDTGLRIDGIPALDLWEDVIDTFYPESHNESNRKLSAAVNVHDN